MRGLNKMNKIIPNLWFDGNADEAAEFYVSIFPDGKILSKEHYPKTKEDGLADFQLYMAGKVLTVEFEILNTKFIAINAGPEFKFNESVSFMVPCKDQAEIDYYWERLSAVSENEQCGWCKDKFGLSWQVCPENWAELTKKPGAFKTLMTQKKIIIAEY